MGDKIYVHESYLETLGDENIRMREVLTDIMVILFDSGLDPNAPNENSKTKQCESDEVCVSESYLKALEDENTFMKEVLAELKNSIFDGRLEVKNSNV